MLTEVHRQAQENPIIALSMLARRGDRLPLGDYGSSKIISRREITPGQILATDQVIVGLNRTRQAYNARMRELLKRPPSRPVKGDKLICLRNDRSIGTAACDRHAKRCTKRRSKFSS
jgi:exodeoxyribonuclease-5